MNVGIMKSSVEWMQKFSRWYFPNSNNSPFTRSRYKLISREIKSKSKNWACMSNNFSWLNKFNAIKN